MSSGIYDFVWKALQTYYLTVGEIDVRKLSNLLERYFILLYLYCLFCCSIIFLVFCENKWQSDFMRIAFLRKWNCADITLVLLQYNFEVAFELYSSSESEIVYMLELLLLLSRYIFHCTVLHWYNFMMIFFVTCFPSLITFIFI